jgi:sec-independent protein translocase protein TatA
VIEGLLQPSHLILILVIVMIVFGAGKLPETMRDLGRATRGFREEMEGKASTVTAAPSPVSCASCGTVATAGAKFCASCGKAL